MSHWQPTASHAMIKTRARLLKKIRAFFDTRHYLEVETPILNPYTVTDVHIESFSASYNAPPHRDIVYLQTSPEYAMKRLLAAGSGSIYQLSKAFRNGECGRYHNPEFTLLEWYQIDYDHHQLMAEVDAFLHAVADTPSASYISYEQLYQHHFQINPHDISQTNLQHLVSSQHINTHADKLSTDDCFNLLMSHIIEPTFAKERPTFIYDYPASQAALAKIRHDPYPVAERFEVYLGGMELANGFHELQDPIEQRKRFMQQQHDRQSMNSDIPEIDPHLIAALQTGLPTCAGVALGIDRLLMHIGQQDHIKDVLCFGW